MERSSRINGKRIHEGLLECHGRENRDSETTELGGTCTYHFNTSCTKTDRSLSSIRDSSLNDSRECQMSEFP